MDNRRRAPILTISPYAPTPTLPLRRGLGPTELWALSKQIDELEGEWTFPIFQWRALNFHNSHQPVGFYEPMSNFERLQLEAWTKQRAEMFCPQGDDGGLGVELDVFPSIFDTQDGVIPLPANDEKSVGRHAMGVLGVHDEDTLVIRNSWSGWSKAGIGYLSREYFNRHAAAAWLFRRWDRGPMATTVERLLSTNEDREFYRLWTYGRRQGHTTRSLSTSSLSLHWYECWSMHDERPAEVLTINLNRYLRVGVATLTHPNIGDPPSSYLLDIFIWPIYRRMAYGRMLERFAEERSRVHGASTLGVHVWDADVVNGSERATAFLAACGYTEVAQIEGAQYEFYAERTIDTARR